MALSIGTRLGPYEILAAIGAGGMGEVYRARDTRLDRTVALKVLSPSLASAPEFRERFDREARTISQLDHPHICTLYDVGEQDGTSFLVMQYLEGETLETRLKKGALPLDQALQFAIQIADALDKAHRAGIVHRDLKPGNVMLTKSGAMLLDFGLAKTTAVGAAAGLSMLPTTPAGLTAQGTILGTFQYMAPEQLEGREADARTDIFAFGDVLYEMVTGRKAFEGKSQVSLIGAILEREPAPVSSLQPASPPTLDAVIKRCLAKDPGDRWQSAADLSVTLKWLSQPPTETSATVVGAAHDAPRSRRTPLLWMIAGSVFALTTVALGLVEMDRFRSTAASQLMRFSILPPDKMAFDDGTGFASFNAGHVSPDGTKIAFSAKDASGKVQLWVRPLDSLTAQPLPGTDDALLPFWSPDSQWIAFGSGFSRLKRVDISGGGAETLCNESGVGGAGSWNRAGVILTSSQTGIRRVGPNGCTAITKVSAGEVAHVFPSFLPDGRHFVYYAVSAVAEKSTEHLAALDSTDDRPLFSADSAAIYAPTGHLLFVRQGTLFAQAFDAKALKFTSDPIRLAQSIPTDLGAPAFSVSDTGILSFRTGAAVQDIQFAWFDRAGARLDAVGPPGNYRGVDLSPDGRRVAVHLHDDKGGDIWVFEPRHTVTRLTFDATQHNSSPIWSSDGRFIIFGSQRNGKPGLYRKASDGTGPEELLLESGLGKIPTASSPDDKYIVYWSYEKLASDQWVLPLTGDRKPAPFLNSSFNESHGQISPDGKWMAYSSDETGRTEIYVRPFPTGEGRWQVSTNGGVFPRWRHDGKELFYMSAPALGGANAKLVAVPVQATGSTFEAGSPRELFDSGYVDLPHFGANGGNYHTYAVSPDGRRFLIPRPVAGSAATAQSPITIVLNWTAALKK
jgi:serine/threonine protein kinase